MNQKQERLLQQYEAGIARGQVPYFDADDFEVIITLYGEKDQFHEAIGVCDCALNLHPGNETVLAHKAKNLMYLDEEAAARVIIEQLSDTTDFLLLVKAEFWLGLDAMDRCRALLDQVVERFGDDPYIFLDIVDFLTAYEEYELSIEYLKEGLKRHPGNENLLCELSLSNERSSRWEENVDIVNILLDINPYSLTYWMGLARTYSALREYEKCVEACEFALTIEPKSLETLMLLADAFYMSENYLRAAQIFLELVELNAEEERPAMYTLTAECYMQSLDYDKATSYILKALEINPSFSYGYYTYASIAYSMGDYDLAMENIEFTLALDAESSEAHYLKGSVFYQRGMLLEAEQAYFRSVELDSTKVFMLRPSFRDAIVVKDYAIIKAECLRFIDIFPDMPIFPVLLLSFAFKNNDMATVDKFLSVVKKFTEPDVREEEWTEEYTLLFLSDVCDTEEEFTKTIRLYP